MSFPTKDEMMQMSVAKLRLIDINNKEEEDLVQAVVRLKEVQNSPQTPVNTLDVPDIKTAEEEAKWQKILDDRRAGLKPQVEVKSDESGIEIKVEQAEVKAVEGFKCETCGKISKTSRLLAMHKGRFHKVIKQ